MILCSMRYASLNIPCCRWFQDVSDVKKTLVEPCGAQDMSNQAHCLSNLSVSMLLIAASIRRVGDTDRSDISPSSVLHWLWVQPG